MRKYQYIALICAGSVALSCAKDINQRTIHEGSGLGYPVKICNLEASAGKTKVDVIATRDYCIKADASWLTVPSQAPAGRDGFSFNYSANSGLPRAGHIVIGIEETSHYDTLTVRQKGAVSPELAAASPVVSVKGSAGGNCKINLATNIPDNAFTLTVENESETEWISGVKVSGSALQFDYAANPDSHVRRAGVRVSYTDAFGVVYEIPFQVLQLSAEDSAGGLLSIAELCTLATEEGYEIEQDVTVEGLVVSDKDGGNCPGNVIYLEAVDGSCGISLEAKRADDNVFLQGDKVTFSLRGTILTKSLVLNPEKDPVYYQVSGVRGNMAVECEHLGREAIPVKERYIGGLTDADIFTYVTLKDCEFPVRKGSLAPVGENFTGEGKVDKFPVLVHDICGGSLYMYTDIACPYAGEALPQGSGTLSGVIVHERYARFCYQDNESADDMTWGNIGRYQIRHTGIEDFGLAQTMEEQTFSAVICEWSYILDKNLEKYYATDGDIEAYFTYSYVYPDNDSQGRAGKLPIIKATDYSFGEIPSDEGKAWATNITVNGGKPHYTTLVFSTAGLSGSRMSLQLSTMNLFSSSTHTVNGAKIYLEGPRYWWVEYSLDGNEWTKAAGYSVPDLCQTSPKIQPWQTGGFKSINVPLPAAELLGQEKVYIRIIPDEGLQTGTQTAYLDPSIVYPSSGSFPTAWNYIGIRYNTVDPPATEFGDGSDIDPMNPYDYEWK